MEKDNDKTVTSQRVVDINKRVLKKNSTTPSEKGQRQTPRIAKFDWDPQGLVRVELINTIFLVDKTLRVKPALESLANERCFVGTGTPEQDLYNRRWLAISKTSPKEWMNQLLIFDDNGNVKSMELEDTVLIAILLTKEAADVYYAIRGVERKTRKLTVSLTVRDLLILGAVAHLFGTSGIPPSYFGVHMNNLIDFLVGYKTIRSKAGETCERTGYVSKRHGELVVVLADPDDTSSAIKVTRDVAREQNLTWHRVVVLNDVMPISAPILIDCPCCVITRTSKKDDEPSWPISQAGLDGLTDSKLRGFPLSTGKKTLGVIYLHNYYDTKAKEPRSIRRVHCLNCFSFAKRNPGAYATMVRESFGSNGKSILAEEVKQWRIEEKEHTNKLNAQSVERGERKGKLDKAKGQKTLNPKTTTPDVNMNLELIKRVASRLPALLKSSVDLPRLNTGKVKFIGGATEKTVIEMIKNMGLGDL